LQIFVSMGITQEIFSLNKAYHVIDGRVETLKSVIIGNFQQALHHAPQLHFGLIFSRQTAHQS
jgi:hypothetical protein